MDRRIHRRTALQLMAAAVGPAFGFAAEAKRSSAKWKTAVGLNGFQSGSRKYKKNYIKTMIENPRTANQR